MQINYEPPAEKGNILEKYTNNLNQKAKSGKLDPVIGRNEEIRRVMQILSRRTKNNPVLLGDPGVGKTAIVEGLAQRIVSGDVPDTLRNREILYLDMASLVAGTAFRGEFEDRIKKLINEIEKSEGRYILFMDELHTLVGAGSVQGAMDAANILKPALARGGLHAIGATTLREYRRHIENDAALERRFQPVNIDEPSQDDSLAILRGIKEKYEVHHGIRITDDALIAAVNLSVRYIADRFLPDKAIDLIDEAASGLKIEAESLPDVLDVIKRKITRLEIELASFKKDKGHQARKKKLETEIKNLKNEENRLNSDWQEQKKIIGELQKLRVKLDSLKSELETAERQALLEKAAEIKYGRIPEAEKNLNRLEVDWNKIPEDKRLIREEVTEEDVARVVSRWTGIPVTRLLKSESEKLINLEREIHKRLIDQEEAVSKVSRAIRRNRAGLGEEEKPIGSFLFLGPTGVGKTETAKALAEYLFSDEKALVRIDMSEYQEAHNIARMIGAPPGYVGFEEGGPLTEAVRRKPYSVILFDEIEKAHPQVFNVFLQILDEGRLTDGRGRIVNFKNTILILTSNLGSDIIQSFIGKDRDKMYNQVIGLVRKVFRPEFLNRLDSIVFFNALDKKTLKKIIDLQLERVKDRIKTQNINISFSDELKDFLARTGYDPVYGARPLKRVISEHILDEMALMIIEDKIIPGESIRADFKNDKVVLNKVH